DLRTERWIQREVQIGLAGVLAEGKFTGRRNHVGASSDYSKAIDLASHFYGYDEVLTKYLEFMSALTLAWVEHPLRWIQIEALAAALGEQGQVGGKRVRQICSEASLNRKRYDELAKAYLEQEEAKRLKGLAEFDEAV